MLDPKPPSHHPRSDGQNLRISPKFMSPGHRFRFRLAALLLLLALTPVFADDIQKITPTGYVTDLAGVIPSATRQRLEALCTELEQKTGAQLAIVTVRSLDDQPIEDYAVHLFKHLGVGSKKLDSGALLLLAPSDRKYRIEVGYGLEPIINDARAGDAGRAMVPFLRKNDFGSAVETAAWQLAKYVADDKGVTLSGAPPALPVQSRRQEFHVNPLLVLFVFFILIQILRAGARGGGGGLGGCWWLLPLLSGGGRGGYRGGGGWGGGGGFGGGGGGFGGFGGGSSGGGGASGSW